jgi:ankyrin repeat protein
MDMVRLLVSRGASLTTWGGSSYAVALLNEAYVADDAYSMEEVLHCLKHLGWDINSLVDVDCSRSRRTMLHHAASVLDTYNVRCLTACGANVLAKDEAGNIPLNLAMKATGSAVTKTMSLLLQHKPQEQLDSRDVNGRTPLHYLMSLDSYMSEDTAWILLRAGANPFLEDRFGNTPYKWFLQNRHHWTEIRAICKEYRPKTPALDQLNSRSGRSGLEASATRDRSTAVSDRDFAHSSTADDLIRPTSI